MQCASPNSLGVYLRGISYSQNPTLQLNGATLSVKCGIHRLAETIILEPLLSESSSAAERCQMCHLQAGKTIPVSHTPAIQNHPTATFPPESKICQIPGASGSPIGCKTKRKPEKYLSPGSRYFEQLQCTNNQSVTYRYRVPGTGNF